MEEQLTPIDDRHSEVPATDLGFTGDRRL